MFLDPLNIERTEWRANDLLFLFKKLTPLFPQLYESDFEEIEKKIAGDNVEYLEIAHYEKPEEDQKDPSSILVFQNNRVFYDIVDLDRRSALVDKFRELSGDAARFVKARKVTKNELKKRVEAMIQREVLSGAFDNFEDEAEEDFLDFVEKDEGGVLDRSAFRLIAKPPVLAWLNACQKKEPRRHLPIGDIEWSLDKINEEPTVFLMPAEMDFLSKRDSKIAWSQAKERVFRTFLWSYYTDENYWPEDMNEKLFDQWFDISPLGLIIDIAEDLDL